MKTPFFKILSTYFCVKLIFLLLFTASQSHAEDLKFDKLTVGKEIYFKVTVKKNADGVSILHADGAKRINYKDLSPELAKLVGPFDPKKAQEAQKIAANNELKNDKTVVEAAKTIDSSKLEPSKPFKPVKLQPSNLQPSKGLNASKGVK